MAVDKSLLPPTLIQHPISILRLWMIANRTQNCNAPQGAKLKAAQPAAVYLTSVKYYS
jgi:hypothetical protein